jgi:hypothetical protein
VFEDSRFGPSGLDRPLARRSIGADCGSLLRHAPILGREDIDEACCRLLHHEMASDTIHTFLRSVGVRCCGRGFAFPVLESFVVSDLL